jgi:D-tyrosyl-tRNA(Tyr) deacylase
MQAHGVLDTGRAALGRRGWRIALVACAALALALAGSWALGPWLPGGPESACAVEAMLGCALLVYAIAMALPFVPGIEIGLALMLLLGEEGVLLVYLATQVSLMSSYLAGRLLPARFIVAAFRWLAGKIVNLRIFDDTDGVMNLSILQTGGDILAISQFTLHAKTRKGNRPSYIRAAPPCVAKPVYERFVLKLSELLGKEVRTGVFGAMMQVELVNDGPVTIIIDTREKE